MARKQLGSAPSGATDAATKGYVDTAQLVVVNAQTGNYTLVLADAGKAVEITSGSANTVTIPPNSSVAFPIGTILEIAQLGTGQVSIAAGSGVTLQSTGSFKKIGAQYGAVSIRKRATDTWLLVGDLTS